MNADFQGHLVMYQSWCDLVNPVRYGAGFTLGGLEEDSALEELEEMAAITVSIHR